MRSLLIILKTMEEIRETSYRAYEEALQHEEELQIAYREGSLAGIDQMIQAVKEALVE